MKLIFRSIVVLLLTNLIAVAQSIAFHLECPGGCAAMNSVSGECGISSLELSTYLHLFNTFDSKTKDYESALMEATSFLVERKSLRQHYEECPFYLEKSKSQPGRVGARFDDVIRKVGYRKFHSMYSQRFGVKYGILMSTDSADIDEILESGDYTETLNLHSLKQARTICEHMLPDALKSLAEKLRPGEFQTEKFAGINVILWRYQAKSACGHTFEELRPRLVKDFMRSQGLTFTIEYLRNRSLRFSGGESLVYYLSPFHLTDSISDSAASEIVRGRGIQLLLSDIEKFPFAGEVLDILTANLPNPFNQMYRCSTRYGSLVFEFHNATIDAPKDSEGISAYKLLATNMGEELSDRVIQFVKSKAVEDWYLYAFEDPFWYCVTTAGATKTTNKDSLFQSNSKEVEDKTRVYTVHDVLQCDFRAGSE